MWPTNLISSPWFGEFGSDFWPHTGLWPCTWYSFSLFLNVYLNIQCSKVLPFSIFSTLFLHSLPSSVQLLSHVQLFVTPWTMATLGLPVYHQLPESTQTHVHWVGDAIQPSYPLSSPSPPALNLSQHQGLFQWISSSHQVAKVLELQLQHQSFQWIFRVDFL